MTKKIQKGYQLNRVLTLVLTNNLNIVNLNLNTLKYHIIKTI